MVGMPTDVMPFSSAAADRLARLTPPSCYVFLASNVDSSYIAGQTLHTNGGVVVHG